MKSFLLFVVIVSLLTISNLYSQDIKAKIKGHLAENGFTVVDDLGNVLFRVTGEGNVGIGNDNPLGLLDTRRTATTDQGRSVILQGENGTDDFMSGAAIIQGGERYGSLGGNITLGGASVVLVVMF